MEYLFHYPIKISRSDLWVNKRKTEFLCLIPVIHLCLCEVSLNQVSCVILDSTSINAPPPPPGSDRGAVRGMHRHGLDLPHTHTAGGAARRLQG